MVCSYLIVLAGAICIPSLPLAQYPTLAPPQVTVTSVYTGASADVVESTVTTPLEQSINGVEGMRYMTSTSTNDGVSTITVTFDVSRDPDLAAVEVQNRVSQASALLQRSSPALRLRALRVRLAVAQRALAAAGRRNLIAARGRLESAMRTLHATGPRATLERGYAIVMTGTGRVLRDATETAPGATLDVRLWRGSLAATVSSTTPETPDRAQPRRKPG